MIYTLIMAIDPSKIVALLSQTHLFHGADEDQLAELARQFKETSLDSKQILYEEGSYAGSFYLIFEGQLILTQKKKGTTRILTTLGKGDYFGEEALFKNKHRIANATATTACILLRLDHHQLLQLLQQIPNIKIYLQIAGSSRRMIRRRQWKWLNPNEVVYILVRKHPYYLYINLILPGLALAGSVILFILIYLLLNLKSLRGFQFSIYS